MEAWDVVDGGLVADGIVKDVSQFHPTPSAKGSKERLLPRFFTDCLYPSTNWTIFQLYGTRSPHSVQLSGSS